MTSEINLEKNEGYLEVIMGPMYASKTSYLLKELNIYTELNLKVMYINSELDTRDERSFSTHNPLINSIGKIDGYKSKTLTGLYETALTYDVIGIDEAQFFEDLESFVVEMVETRQKRVFVAGLSSDFLREPFKNIYSVLPLADKIEHLKSACSSCIKNRIYKTALFSKRIIQNDEQVVIGGKDAYIPVCRACYFK